jgi:hypothetical protein
VIYGVGGAGGVQNGTSSNGTSASANTGSGGGGASVFGATYRNGGAGGSGVVIVRYSTTLPTFSNFSIVGNQNTVAARSNVTLNVTVDTPSQVTFFAGKARIAGCIGIATTGTGLNNVASCNWRPSVKGSTSLAAEASPINPGLLGTANANFTVAVTARTGRR